MAEWSKALAWKVSMGQKLIEGSNPSRSATVPYFDPSKTPKNGYIRCVYGAGSVRRRPRPSTFSHSSVWEKWWEKARRKSSWASSPQPRSRQAQTLNHDITRDQHVRHAYVETAFAAQGRTADHVIIHFDSRAANLVDQKSFYVGVSRARELVAI